MRLILGFFGEQGTVHLQGPVHLIGGNMVETLSLIFLGKALPIYLGSLQKAEGTHNVGAGECERILDAPVDVGFGGKVDDSVDLLLLHKGQHGLEIAYVRFNETVVGLLLYILEIRKVTCIGQLVDVDYLIFRILVHEQAHDVAADESSSSGNNYSLVVHYQSCIVPQRYKNPL